MDVKYEKIVSSLKDKIAKIISMYEIAKVENIKTKDEVIFLKGELHKKDIAYNNLNRRYENLKLAKTVLASDEDPHEAKIKVNRIVREIDKCLALLNK